MTNSEFSFPSLEILMKSDHNILSLVTNPPEEIGRKKKYSSNSYKSYKYMEFTCINTKGNTWIFYK